MGQTIRPFKLSKTPTPTKQQHPHRDRVRCSVVALSEVKKISFGFGKHIVALPISSLTGNVGVEIAKHFSGCKIGFTNGM
jgi:hypothetical protein